jgi:hypothetical protein
LKDSYWRWNMADTETVTVEDGVIKATPRIWGIDGDIISYCPFDFPLLANALAKVSDEADALQFVRAYGLLGYSGLLHSDLEAQDVAWKGDPLPWFLAQASSIRFALHLIASLPDASDEDLARRLRAQTIDAPLKAFDPLAEDDDAVLGFQLVEGPRVVFKPLGEPERWSEKMPSQVGKHQVLAAELLAHLVNANTGGVRHKLRYHSLDNGIHRGLTARALIEAIWSMVGEAASLATESRFSGVRLCEECGAPFIVTNMRQKFCPNARLGDSSESNCGARARMRRKRRDKKTGKSK